MDNLRIKDYPGVSKTSNSYVEWARTTLLDFSYLLIERRTNIRKFFRTSYTMAGKNENHKNIPLSTGKGDGAKSLSQSLGGH